jgi:predicted nucleic acid-binding protein
VRDIVLDTNVFVASLVKEDKFHKDAVALIEALDSKKVQCHISRIIPVEVCAVISRRTGEKEASEAQEILEDWTKEGKIKCYDLNERRAKEAQKIAINAKIKGMDAIAVQLSYELGVPLKTYDEEIKKKVKEIKFV